MTAPAIEVRGIEKSFGKLRVLRGVDLTVERGSVFALLGSNGAGKQGGIVERLQSMPIARSSVLWSHVLTSLVSNLVSVAIVVGVALLKQH